ncbi:MAG: SMC family ATPase [Deinococcota bacterium]
MKPLKLELSGFGCFRQATEIPFDDLGLFAIAGPTGSGKSTILDAITYALYGQTPRLGSRGLDVLISPGLDQLQVTLSFDVPAGTYRVGRSLHRTAKRTEAQARLETPHPDTAGKWKVVPDTEKVRALNDRLVDIIGLDYDGFTRAVLLPQGAFDTFLRGDAKARRRLLVTLLGIERLETMQRLAGERAKDAKQALQNIYVRLEEDYAGATPERLDEVAAEQADLTSQQQDAQDKLEHLNTSLQELDALKALTDELTSVQTEYDDLTSNAKGHEANQMRLEQAERASLLKPQLQLLTTRQAEFDDAQKELKRLEAAQKASQSTRDSAQQAADEATQAAKQLPELDAKLRKLETANDLLEQLSARGGGLDNASHSVDNVVYSEQAWQAYQSLANHVPQLTRAEADLASSQGRFEKLEKELKAAQDTLEQTQQMLNAQGDIEKQRAELDTRVQEVDKAVTLLEQLTVRGGKLISISDQSDQSDIIYSEQAWQAHQDLTAQLPNLASVGRDHTLAQQTLQTSRQILTETTSTVTALEADLTTLEQAGKDAKATFEQADADLNAARVANQAAAVRMHLVAGEPCPVCLQTVQMVPEQEDNDLVALEQRRSKAEQTLLAKREDYRAKSSDLKLTRERLAGLQADVSTQEEAVKASEKVLAEAQVLFIEAGWVTAKTLDTVQDVAKQRREALLASLAGSITQVTDGRDPSEVRAEILNQKRKLEAAFKKAQDAVNSTQRAMDKVQTQLEQTASQVTEQTVNVNQAREQLSELIKTHIKPAGLLKEWTAKRLKTLTPDELTADVDAVKQHLLGSLAARVLDITDGQDPAQAAETLQTQKQTLEATQQQTQDAVNSAQRELDKVNTQLEQHTSYLTRVKDDVTNAQKSLDRALNKADFADVATLQTALLEDTELVALREQVRQTQASQARLSERLAALHKQLAGRTFESDVYAQTQLAKDDLGKRVSELQQRLGALEQQHATLSEQLAKAGNLREQLPALESTMNIYQQLNQDLRSDKFQEFLITRVQSQLAVRASAIIREVSEGRYDLRLIHGDYHVLDAWNAGEMRSTKTLSGGETFIASLALALALSDTVASGTSLGALFLDEGFGTLDSDALEAVTQVLENLSAEGRIVGIITHVKELTERLPQRLLVQKGPDGSTVDWD